MGKRLETKLGQDSGAAWSRADNNSGIETQKLLATGILRSSFTAQRKLRGESRLPEATGILRSSFTAQRKLRGEMELRLAKSRARGIGRQAGGLAVSRRNPCHRSRESVASSLWL